MNTQKVISGFFFILAMTINFGFVYGDPANLEYHSVYELFAAIVINLIATILKLGDKTQLGSVLLAESGRRHPADRFCVGMGFFRLCSERDEPGKHGGRHIAFRRGPAGKYRVRHAFHRRHAEIQTLRARWNPTIPSGSSSVG